MEDDFLSMHIRNTIGTIKFGDAEGGRRLMSDAPGATLEPQELLFGFLTDRTPVQDLLGVFPKKGDIVTFSVKPWKNKKL